MDPLYQLPWVLVKFVLLAHTPARLNQNLWV